jgi:predicted aspartyl protease
MVTVPPLNPAPSPIPTPALNPNPVLPTPGFTQKEVPHIPPATWLKMAYIGSFIILFLAGTVYFARRYFSKSSGPGEILFETPYQPVLWQDFGEVFEPLIKIPIYYPDKGYQQEEFLLDSGAVVSSLPREKAKDMGYSLAKLPRSTFAGFGNTTSFAYKASLKVKVGDKEMNIPVVFTEATGTKSILGRSGFFENYSIYFNAQTERIEIRR